MTIQIERAGYDLMVRYAIDGLPNEVCGLIAGFIDNSVKCVKKIYLLTNIDKSPEHFSMDPKEQLEAIKDMRKAGWVLLGNFHSHPSTPARPSQEDIRLAFDPKSSYLILSLEKTAPVLKAFEIVDGTVTPQIIEIIP